MTNRIAIYPGSFDPVTNGHVDVALRGARLFDEFIIAVAHSDAKKTLFSPNERVSLIEEALQDLNQPNIRVISFGGLLIDFARSQQATVLIRGLRAVTDFEYEFQLAGMNQNLAPEIETIFLPTVKEHAFLSSSLIKEISLLNGEVSSFVPKNVAKALKEKQN